MDKPAITPRIVFLGLDNVILDVAWVNNQRLELLLDQAGHLLVAPELVMEVLAPGEEN